MHTTMTMPDVRNTLVLKVFTAKTYTVQQLLVCSLGVEVDLVQAARGTRSLQPRPRGARRPLHTPPAGASACARLDRRTPSPRERDASTS